MKPLSLKALSALFISLAINSLVSAEDGYRLWLRYESIQKQEILDSYLSNIGTVDIAQKDLNPTLRVAADELQKGLSGLLGSGERSNKSRLLIGTASQNPKIAKILEKQNTNFDQKDEYLVFADSKSKQTTIVITGSSDQAVLYGVFAFLRHLQTHQPIEGLSLRSAPRVENRILNHWDNLTRTIERSMSGASLWNWFDLPYYIEPYYIDYARACASVGINGTVLTNVNANSTVLHPQFIEKVAALADTFRPYGIRVYLTARFSAPIELGGLDSADPLDPVVIKWWNDKVAEIYEYVPDFGGFLVKANSEGQPGPQKYGRDHADGANMLADALAPHGGIVMWRAFVYDFEIKEDRHKQAYTEFTNLDGRFRENAIVQTKNGAIDFMPREPYHPLFGATPETTQALELQITQEYLGGDVHLAYLAPMWREVLNADTFAQGKGSTVAKVIDGSVFSHKNTTFAGVSNAGNERNWTGHPIAASNWYAFGRLAWDHTLSSEQIADEWIRMTFNNQSEVVDTIANIMLASHQTVVDYSMPLGLHHIMAEGHHYGPGPWFDQGRPDWTSVYYHRADEAGIGFDRTESGTNALGQYFPERVAKWSDPEQIDERYLLWFHHVSWDFEMDSGETLWNELCLTYQRGVNDVAKWIQEWDGLSGKIDAQRHARVAAMLIRQHADAIFWKDACLSYFQTFSKRPYPKSITPPENDLEHYKNFKLYHVPGHPAEQW
ncbi:alpha-glucuronidase family glycosyl hydrolase [Pelagicoccus mobilis]|uniref:Xylan alpha-1,2-glucuronidase n=1 Tax=Pelagicoccus mobilis TaxID=415221 RepID=A0A934VQI1_9BACT|nr:alpha-glucuronidase family glycosyl hydrolase [Pelagicoccus mobilis]MBK1878377.1 hypothetical protein [Pelagicoccus mobilis]